MQLFSLARILLALAPSAALAQSLPYEIDVNSLSLSGPPAAGTVAEKQDYLTIKNWQSSRTQEQCESAAAQTFKKLPPLFFTGAPLPPIHSLNDFTPFMDKIVNLSMRVTQPFQERFNRMRPFQQYSDIVPCLDRPNTQSYPSSHATTGMLFALLLSEIVPAQRPALMKLGLQIGENRVMGGVHFPSDVAAGQALAEQLWKQIRVHPLFLQEARELRGKTALFRH